MRRLVEKVFRKSLGASFDGVKPIGVRQGCLRAAFGGDALLFFCVARDSEVSEWCSESPKKYLRLQSRALRAPSAESEKRDADGSLQCTNPGRSGCNDGGEVNTAESCCTGWAVIGNEHAHVRRLSSSNVTTEARQRSCFRPRSSCCTVAATLDLVLSNACTEGTWAGDMQDFWGESATWKWRH